MISLEAFGAGPSMGENDATTGFSWNIIQHLADGVEENERDGRHIITMRWATLQRRMA